MDFCRLRQTCIYEPRSLPSPSSTPSPESDTALYPQPFTPDHIKNSIIQRLGSVEPKEIAPIYSRAIDQWFPIISLPLLQSRLPPSWDGAPLDLTLLCVSITLLTSPPTSEDHSNPSNFKSLYLCIKSWISLIEGLGINSLLVVQSRILVTLFEIAHGFYPAAYISIGSTVRAADALEVHAGLNSSLATSSKSEGDQADEVTTWCGILVLDRYASIL